jgi:uncharacterized protein involved in high-affinity Fe2+ transport
MRKQPHTSSTRRVSRRQFLIASTATATALSGCANEQPDGSEETSTPEVADTENGPRIPQVENPPDAVYLPAHRAGMMHLSTVEAGEYTLLPMISYPHRFWLMTGTDTEAVTPSDSGIHLMFTVWDTETRRVLPVDAGAQIRISRDGELVDQRAPWPMISQTMGFHFGDNVPLTEDGTYAVDVDLNPINVKKTGAFEGRFEDSATATFEFEYDGDIRRQLIESVEYLDEERWGKRGALEPMMQNHSGESHDHGRNGGSSSMPFSALPRADAYPGQNLGTPQSGGATFVLRYLENSRFAEEGGYLIVSPRTPHNRVPLPDTALSISGASEQELTQTLDDGIGHHYGAAVDLSAGDELQLTVETPPQVARHAGYETAFIEMEPITVDGIS